MICSWVKKDVAAEKHDSLSCEKEAGKGGSVTFFSMTEDQARIAHLHTRNRLYIEALRRHGDHKITIILPAL